MHKQMNRTQQKFKFFTDLNEDKIEKKKKNNQQMSLVAYPNFFKKKFANFTNSKCTELKIQRTQKRSREEKKNTDYIQINDLKNRIKSIKVKKKKFSIPPNVKQNKISKISPPPKH